MFGLVRRFGGWRGSIIFRDRMYISIWFFEKNRGFVWIYFEFFFYDGWIVCWMRLRG